MTSNLKDVRWIDKDTKYTVYGYIRKQQIRLTSSPYTLFREIPITMISLCILYFRLLDRFQIIGKNVSLSINNRTITKLKSGWFNTTYGQNIIPSTSKCIAKWMLLLPTKKYDRFMFGIQSTYHTHRGCMDMCVPNYYIDRTKCKYYCIWPRMDNSHSRVRNHNTKKKEWDWRPKLNQGNMGIVCLELNLKEKMIVLYDSNEQKHELFLGIEIAKDIKYRLAVSMQSKDCKISILGFSTKKPHSDLTF